MKHFDIKVYGRVQGVSFRYYTNEKARHLGIKGFVKNQADGSVYIEAEGNEQQMGHFLDWCHEGPASAHVKNVEVRESELQNYRNFELRY
ncbi:MAG: acylphosphatase [SAR324 cluster bacterium]|nr:acylphosphatase [SAR324 cluster bacterium]